MQTQQSSLDQYFTEQIVGAPVSVSLGPTARVRQLPGHGAVIDRISGEASLLRQATLSLLSDDPATALAGQAIRLPGLARTRRRLLLLGLLAWTAAVVAVLHWWPA
jgi:hypothetical protein